MHQRFVERAERMAAAGMPDTSAGGIALVSQPDMRFEIVQFVIADDVFGVTDDF